MSGPPDDYCCFCYGDAAKVKRPVRDTKHGRCCALCESRANAGLVHYRPSNGTEGRAFESRCQRCAHFIGDEVMGRLTPPFTACQWGILDRMFIQQMENHEHISTWFEPGQLLVEEEIWYSCAKFTHRNDGDRDSRGPNDTPIPGQLGFEDLLEVKEVVPKMKPSNAVTK